MRSRPRHAAGGRSRRGRTKRGDQVFRPYAGPQTWFLASPAYELGYGGSAGSGKSFALLLELAAEIDNPEYCAIAFRRTFPELKATLIEESKRIYPGLGGVYHETDHLWRFPSGARVYLGHLQHEKDVEKYRGPEYGRIVFDELTTFTEAQYRFMFSRLRRRDGKPCYMRSGTNPGGVGHDFVLRRFAPWLYPKGHDEYDGPITEPGTKVRERLGEKPYAASGEILWVRATDDGHEFVCDRHTHDPGCPNCAPGRPCVRHRPVSRSFILARISDNPTYAGTEYEARLYQLDPLTRAQMLDGDWLARPAAGMFFKRAWFQALTSSPTDIVARVRYWDRAASEVTPQNSDPDWTVGVLLAVTTDRRFIVEDVIRVRESPAKVESTIVTQAALDPPGTVIGLELDPAAAGKFEAMSYTRLLIGYAVTCVPPWGDKITRAKPVSSQVEAKNFYVLPGAWNRPYLQTMESFGEPNVHDDDVDATSGAFRLCVLAYEQWLARRKRASAGAGVRSIAAAPQDEDDDD